MTDSTPLQRLCTLCCLALGLALQPAWAVDTAPDPIVFPAVSNAERASTVISASRAIAGIDISVPISVSGGAYSINNGSFTTASGRVRNGDAVRVAVIASEAFSTSVSVKLRVGVPASTSTFKVTTRRADTVPDAFSFVPRSEAAPGSTQISEPTTITGLEAAAPISVSSGGSYSINGGPFTSAAGTVGNNARVSARGTASTSAGTTTNVAISIGGVSSSFRITTVRTADTTPNPFSFPATTQAAPGSLQNSDPITVTGLTAASPISIVGGFYSIDGQAFTDAPGSVSNNASVVVQVLSAFGYLETREAVLTIGGVSGTYRVTTHSMTADASPDAFAFAPVVDALAGSVVSSEPIVVTGIDIAVPISVSGGRYQINGGAFTDAPGDAVDGDVVVAEVQASEQPSATRRATVTIGDKHADFTVTTSSRIAADHVPAPIWLGPVFNAEPGGVKTSRPARISGITDGTPISVAGGRYSVNGGAFTSADGIVSNDDSVVVEATASSEFAARRDAVLTVGTSSTTFTVATRSADTSPNAFAFAPIVDAANGSVRTSAGVTIVGIDAPAKIVVINGQYSVGGAAFTSQTGEIRNGDVVRVRTLAASTAATTSSATVTIGDVTAVFHVTTTGADITPARIGSISNPAAFPLLATVSPAITVSGVSAPIPVSVTAGEYSINGGPFLSMPGAAGNGDQIRVMAVAGPNRGDIVTATLILGGITGTYTVTADAPADDFADFFEFRDVAVARNTLVRSETIEVRGINVATSISVVGGTYSINGGAFRSSASTVKGGDLVTLQANSSSGYGTETRVTLNIGRRSTAWSLHTDADPAQLRPFTLLNAEMYPGGFVPPGRALTTNPIVVAGAPSPSAISVSGGSYSINGGPFTSAPGSVINGDSVVVQFFASASHDTSSAVTLTIGALSSTLSVTTTIDAIAATPTAATDCTAHVFRQQQPVPLRVFVCRPAGWRSTDRRSALIHWFGGGFVFGNTDNAVGEARYWANTHGMVGIAPDYRVNERFGTFAYVSADDGRAALRWVQANAAELGIDPARIALSGSSAGGGVAFFAGLRDAPVTGSADDNPLQRPAAIVTRAGVPDITTESHIQRFEAAELFDSLGPVLSPSVNLDARYPPVLMFHGDRDTTVAPTPSVNFCWSLIRLGIRCDYRNQAGMGHDVSENLTALDAIREETRVFLTSLGLLPAVR